MLSRKKSRAVIRLVTIAFVLAYEGLAHAMPKIDGAYDCRSSKFERSVIVHFQADEKNSAMLIQADDSEIQRLLTKEIPCKNGRSANGAGDSEYFSFDFACSDAVIGYTSYVIYGSHTQTEMSARVVAENRVVLTSVFKRAGIWGGWWPEIDLVLSCVRKGAN